MRREGKERVFKGSEATESELKDNNDTYDKRKIKVGPPSPHVQQCTSFVCVHGVKHGVPYVCFHIGPHIFIESLAWAAFESANLQGFSNSASKAEILPNIFK